MGLFSHTRCVFWGLLLLIALLAPCFPAAAIDDMDCMVCHSDPSATYTSSDGQFLSLYVDEEVYSHSVHAGMGCVTCHADITDLPHAPTLEPVNCGVCHMEAEEYSNSLHGKALAAGDGDLHGCQDCHGKHNIRRTSDPLSLVNKLNQATTCGQCHSDPDLARRHKFSVRNPAEGYLQSVHAQAIRTGNLEAAVCNDCHGTHDILPAHLPDSPVNRWNIAETCGKCHAEVVEQFMRSIHGQALLAGVRDAPTCNDCHGEHQIEGPALGSSPVSRRIVSKQTCPKCHDDVTIMSKFGIETMRQASYMDSYHGMASAAGSLAVASCTSCHGVHDILPHSDPESATHVANLPATCAQCHPDAGENFAKGAVHIMPTSPDQKALGIVRVVYLWLIAITLGGMVLHNTLLMLRHMVGKLVAELGGRKVHPRFNKGQTIGHFVLSLSFTALAISGFALRYPESWWSQILFFGDTGLEARALVHRIAGVVFIGVTLVNLAYSLFTRGGRKELRSIVITRKDAADVLKNMGYALGLSNKRPKYDRYSYSEKLEYWGLWWGSVIMIVTGLCMWYANTFLMYLPKYLLDIAALIHWYEAWLAVGTIVLWHLYYMIFDPESYPMNWSWVTGKITEEDYKHHHPLEYEREVLANQEPPAPAPEKEEVEEEALR